MDVRKTVTDAGYIAIGLGVMGYQQAQTRRRELTTKLGDVPGKLERQVPGPASSVKFPASSAESPGKLGDLGKLSAVSGKVEERGREVAGIPRRGQPPDRRPRRCRPRPRRGPGPIDGHPGPGAGRRSRQARRAGAWCRCRSQLGDLPERVVQVIEPVAAKVRERTRQRRSKLEPHLEHDIEQVREHARTTFRACSLRLPAVSVLPVSLPGSCAPCRPKRSSPSSTPATTTSSTGCTSPPISTRSPTRSPALRTPRRAGDSKARRSPRSTRSSRYDVPTWFRLGDNDLATHLFRTAAPARGRDALRGHRRDHARRGISACGSCR